MPESRAADSVGRSLHPGNMDLRTGPGMAAVLGIPGIGEKRALLLADRFGTWGAVLAAQDAEIRGLLGQAVGTKFLRTRPEILEAPALPPGCTVISILDPEYPARLRGIPNPPTLLWVRGTLPPPGRPAVAIVGTRHPTAYGQAVARQAATSAVEAGLGVVSGLATGSDSLAHAAALAAGGGTWAVLGCGVDMVAADGPRGELAARIVASGGGLIAEVPPGTPTAVHLLTRRNRLQSGLALATLIAQSGLPGAQPAGTMHTARFTIEQGRLLVVPQPRGRWADEPESAGNLALTDPHGCDPAVVYATKPDIVARIAARKPVADIVPTRHDDLPAAWEAVHRRPEPSAEVAGRAGGMESLPLPLG